MLKIHVSKGNSKMGNIPSISFPPIITCNNCAGCTKSGCYAVKAYRQYPNVRTALDDNLSLWHNSPDVYFQQLFVWLKKHTPTYFRFNVSGDIPDEHYVTLMYAMAYNFPKTKFLAYTKQTTIINPKLNELWSMPDNLTVRLSSWFDFTPHNPHNLPVATIKDIKTDTSSNNANGFNCVGSCVDCKVCWSRDAHNVTFTKH